MAMISTQYKCSFTVNGKHMTQVVYANNEVEAQKIIKVQYPGCRIQWYSGQRVR